MKTSVLACAGILLSGIAASHAAVYDIDLSPLGGALNLGANPYVRDHATGLSGLNTSAMFPASGSGGEFGSGITYDDVTQRLSFDIAYGSAYGFADLLGDLTILHIHRDGLVNYPAANSSGGVEFSLGAFHTPSGPRSGRITGSLVFTAVQEAHLFDNALYVNIHSEVEPSGEIRGQFIVVPEPSTCALLAGVAIGAVALARRRR